MADTTDGQLAIALHLDHQLRCMMVDWAINGGPDDRPVDDEEDCD